MTNEDIIKAIEAFRGWGDEDKKKVIKSLTDSAIQNMMWWLSQTSHGKYFMDKNAPVKEEYISQDEWDRSRPDGWKYID